MFQKAMNNVGSRVRRSADGRDCSHEYGIDEHIDHELESCERSEFSDENVANCIVVNYKNYRKLLY